MEIIKMKAHIGKDGSLQLAMPAGVADVDCEVLVTISRQMTPEEWNLFVDVIAGSLANDPIERLPQYQ